MKYLSGQTKPAARLGVPPAPLDPPAPWLAQRHPWRSTHFALSLPPVTLTAVWLLFARAVSPV